MKTMQKFSILFLMLITITSFSYSMENTEQKEPKLAPELQPKGKGKARPDKKMDESSSSPQMNDTSINDMSDIAKYSRLLAKVFAQAPIDVKNIVNHLTDPAFLEEPRYRFAFLIGAPGVGKSTQADAVASELLKYGWSHQKYASTDFQDKNRGGTAEKLNNVLSEIKPEQKILLLIDEINHLFEHADDKHHDTDATSKALWAFLDAQAFNHNFFLIGTMNKIEDAPQQIKSRALGKNIWISEAIDNAVKIDILRTCFKDKKFSTLHATCNDAFFKEFVQNIQDWNIRDLTSLAFKSESIFRRTDQTSKKRIIRKEHLEEALQELVEEKQRVKWGKRKENTAERQDRIFLQQLYIQFMQDVRAGRYSSSALHEITKFISDLPIVGNNVSEDMPMIMGRVFTDDQCRILGDLLSHGTERYEKFEARKKKNSCVIQ